MANPSLQIGNDNWAIKEDNLLGYSTAGTRFVPQPITMTRASAGTRVNSSGLVETVELLGSELVDCGNFECASPESVWGTGTGWSIANGLASYDGSGGTQSINQAGVVESSKTYKLTLDVVSNEGSGINTIYLGGVIVSNIHLEVGNYIFFVTTSSTASLAVFGRSGENFVIDNISVKESTKNNLARVDYTDGTSSLLVEPQRTNTVTYSEDFSQWSTARVTVLGGFTAPDGSNNAYKITNGSPDGILYFSGASDTNYTKTIYARTVSGTGTAQLLSHNANTNNTFNLTEEWQRFEVNTTTDVPTIFYAVDFRGSGTLDELLIWGAQAEDASYATSIIPTSGSTVTRNQETYTKTGISDLINSEEGVLFVELENITGTDAINKMISITDGSLTNKISLFVNSNQISVESAGSGTNLGIYSKVLQSGFNKIAVKFKVNDCALWVNGTEYTDTSFTAFSSSTLNSLVFDRGDAGQPFYGKVKQLQIFKTALSDSELATLTT